MSVWTAHRREVVAVATISNVRIARFPARPGDSANSVPRPGPRRTRWAGPGPWAAPLFGAAGCLLAAWTGYLAVSLPERSISWHYNIAWAGFDVLLLVLVLGTAWLTYRRSPHAAATAAADQAPAASPARSQPDRDFMLTAAVTTAHARVRRSLAPGRPQAPDDSGRSASLPDAANAALSAHLADQ
jgi:hypothetical protein